MLISFFLLGVSLFIGCEPASEERFRAKGETIQKDIVEELAGIFTVQDLIAKEEILADLFSKLSLEAIQADKWKKTHCKRGEKALPQESEISFLLEKEFRRVLSIPGAEALLERCQRSAIDRLDAYVNQRPRKPGFPS